MAWEEEKMGSEAFRAKIEQQMAEGWGEFVDSLEKSLDTLEAELDEAAEMAGTCTSEWCEATEHVLDELGNSLFSISEPRWVSNEDSKRIKALKGRLHDLYAKYKAAPRA
jgi:hypothetical protein